jgi:hypothetical protein
MPGSDPFNLKSIFQPFSYSKTFRKHIRDLNKHVNNLVSIFNSPKTKIQHNKKNFGDLYNFLHQFEG